MAASYGAQIAGRFGSERGTAPLEAPVHALPHVKDEHRVWYNPNQNSAWFMSISELLTVIRVFTTLLPAAAMAREKERGTVEQLLVSPLTPFQILFPKVVAMNLVVLGGTAMSIFMILQPIFALPIGASLLLFFAVTALYVLTNSGVGLFIATLGRTLAQVGMLSILIVAPLILLSGIWTPPEAMPIWLRSFMRFSPLYHFIEVSYGILLRGAGLEVLWDSVLSIALLGGAIFGIGVWRFRRRFG